MSWVPMSPVSKFMNKKGFYREGNKQPWTDQTQFPLRSTVVTWELPYASHSVSAGLGAGGVSWALFPSVCEELLSMFPEQNMLFGLVSTITCDDIRLAIQSGFDVWNRNHRQVNFYDNTHLCTHKTLVECESFTEVTIHSARESSMQDKKEAAAFVVINFTKYNRSPRLTNGATSKLGVAPLRARMYINTDRCWYLGVTFCSFIHEIGTTRVVLSFVCIVALAFVAVTAVVAVSFVRTESRSPPTNKTRAHKFCAFVMQVPVWTLFVLMFVLTFPPVALTTVVLPCIECFDFEATMAHEAGHVIGFDHPNTSPDRNLRLSKASSASLRSGALFNSSDCQTDPLNSAELFEMTEEQTRRSIMFSMTQHASRTCLSDDDLEGFYAIYPLCDGIPNTMSASCPHKTSISGYTRLMAATFAPLVVSLIAALFVQTLVRRWVVVVSKGQEKKLKKANLQSMFLRATVAASAANRERERKAWHAGNKTRASRSVVPLFGGFTNRYVSRLSKRRLPSAVQPECPAIDTSTQSTETHVVASNKLFAIAEDDFEDEEDENDDARIRKDTHIVSSRPPSMRTRGRAFHSRTREDLRA